MSEEPRTRRAVAAVAWLLAGGVLVQALFRLSAVPTPADCPRPVERAAVRGWTTDVACAGPASPPGPALRGPARLLFGLTLDLNRADARALEVLPHIGPTRAAAILRARAEAPFDSPADLRRVRGIGARTVDALAGQVHAGGGR